MSNVIQILLYTLIILPFMLYITKKSKKEKRSSKSKKKFEVCCPNTYLRIFIYAAWFFILIFLFLYIYNGLVFSDFDESWLYIGIIITGIILVLLLIFKLWRLDIENDMITYRTFWGHKRKTTFTSIDKVLKTDHHSLVIYANKKRFGTIDSDFKGINNFIERCKMENIEIGLKTQTLLTKARLYFRTMKAIFWIGGILSFAIFLMLTLIPSEVSYTAFEFFVLIVFGFAIVVLPVSFIPLKGLLYIGKQERELGFSFAEEMKQYNIRAVNFVNEQWYIDAERTNIIAFRHDYIKSISKIEKYSANNRSEYKVKIISINGTVLKVRSSYGILNKLKKWSKSLGDV